MTTSNDDIRAWGKDNGFDVEEGARIPPALRKAYLHRNDSPDTLNLGSDDAAPPEQAPKIPKPSIIEKVKDIVAKPETVHSGQSVVGKGLRPRVKKAFTRVPVDRLISRGWGLLAQAVQPVNLPVARVLAIQSPVAGLILEDIVRDTAVDRLLQPLARTEKRGEIAFALVGPPLIVAAMTAKPTQAPILLPLLRESLRVWIDIAGPQLERVAAQEKKFEQEYGQRIDDMIRLFFMEDEIDTFFTGGKTSATV